jgi:hypothetical protein
MTLYRACFYHDILLSKPLRGLGVLTRAFRCCIFAFGKRKHPLPELFFYINQPLKFTPYEFI